MATQYSWLGNPIDRGGWWTIVYEITESWPWLNNWTTITTTQTSSILNSPTILTKLRIWLVCICLLCLMGRETKFHKGKNCVLPDTSQVLNEWINKWMLAKTCDKINLIIFGEFWMMKSGVRIKQNEKKWSYISYICFIIKYNVTLFVTLLNIIWREANTPGKAELEKPADKWSLITQKNLPYLWPWC